MLFRIEYIGICYNWINMDSHTRILEKTEYARSYIIMEKNVTGCSIYSDRYGR